MESNDLYGLPLDEFTAERDRLVKQLRSEDRRDEATAVSALRKPTTDAWALNQVAREQPELVERLLATHRAIREASDGDAFRQASESRNSVLDDLMAAASAILDRGGHSSEGPVRDRITRTLLAAAGDAETEAALRDGTLTRSAEISGQWPGVPIPPGGGEQDTKQDDEERRQEVERLEERAQQLTEKAVELRRRADDAQEALDTARRAASEAEKAAREARKEAESSRRRHR